jgi:type I restriction enzyme M protein
MRNSKQLTAKEFEQLQRKTFYGKEKKSLVYIIGVMNMILHGIEAPNIVHACTAGEDCGHTHLASSLAAVRRCLRGITQS